MVARQPLAQVAGFIGFACVADFGKGLGFDEKVRGHQDQPGNSRVVDAPSICRGYGSAVAVAEQHPSPESDGFENLGQHVERVTFDIVDRKAVTERRRRTITGARIDEYAGPGSFGNTPGKLAPGFDGAEP